MQELRSRFRSSSSLVAGAAKLQETLWEFPNSGESGYGQGGKKKASAITYDIAIRT